MPIAWLCALAVAASDIATVQPSATQVYAPAKAAADGSVTILAGQKATVFETAEAGVIRELSLSPPTGAPRDEGSAALRVVMAWDGSPVAAVDCPARELFGVVPGGPTAYSCDFGMVSSEAWTLRLPLWFARGAKIELANDSNSDLTTRFRCLFERSTEPVQGQGRLHVDYVRQRLDVPGALTLMKAKSVAGHVLGMRVDVTSPAATSQEVPITVDVDGAGPAPVASSLPELLRNGVPALLPEAALLVADMPDWRHRTAGFRSFRGAPIRFMHSCTVALDAQQVAKPDELDVDSAVLWYAAQTFADRPAVMPFDQRRKPYIGIKPPNVPLLAELYAYLKTDPWSQLEFARPDELRRVAVIGNDANFPQWLGLPKPRPGNPNPGRTGILALKPAATDSTCRVAWKVHVSRVAHFLHLALSPDPYEPAAQTAVAVHVALYDGKKERPLTDLVLMVNGPPAKDGWVEPAIRLPEDRASDELLILLDVVPGPRGPLNQELFIDRMEVAEM